RLLLCVNRSRFLHPEGDEPTPARLPLNEGHDVLLCLLPLQCSHRGRGETPGALDVDEGQALLRGILAEPNEDAPRLVFADWLEGNRQPERPQFIRLQCQAARMVEDTQRALLEVQAAALEKQHLAEWLGPLAPQTCRNPSKRDEHFDRGLLHWWCCTVATFLQKAHQRDVCEWFPRLGVECVCLTD